MKMEDMHSSENAGPVSRAYRWLAALAGRWKKSVSDLGSTAKRIGEEDPRRIVHGFKVALAINLVSVFYYLQPLYDDFGSSLMWAILTVVVVFEYTIGGTIGKGINRMIATFLAGFLGTLAYRTADLTGNIGKPILLAVICFIAAGLVTFMRFIPKLKARYDYGLLIFILTFSLVSVSGYRDGEEVIKIAHQRLSTIIVGSCIAMCVCVCICPVWNGDELQKLVSNNLDKLGDFLQDFGESYFIRGVQQPEEEGKSNKGKIISSSLEKYKSILGSKSTEESMANLAAWEPPHGRFRFRHPWKQYLKVGSLARQCAYTIDSLNNCRLNSILQAAPEIRVYIQEACTTLSSESGKALKELSISIKKMERPSSAAITHVNKSKRAAEDLRSLLENSTLSIPNEGDDDDDLCMKDHNLLDLMSAVTVASLLLDAGTKLEEVSEAVHELSTLAKFKSAGTADHKAVTPPLDGEEKKQKKVVVMADMGGGAAAGNYEGKKVDLELHESVEEHHHHHHHRHDVVINIERLVCAAQEEDDSMGERNSSPEKEKRNIVDGTLVTSMHRPAVLVN